MLVPFYMYLIIFKLLPFPFHFKKFLLILLPYQPLLFFQRRFKLWSFLNSFASHQYL